MNKKTIAKVGIVGVVLFGITECTMIVAAPAIAEEEHATQTLSIDPHFGLIEQIIESSRFNRMNVEIVEDAYPWLNPEKAAEQLSVSEVKDILKKAGFTGYGLRMAQAIVFKESTRRQYAHNQNERTGDNSYGLFQINMFRGLEAARQEAYGLLNNEELFDPMTNALIAYKISNGGTNWSAWTTYPAAKEIVGNYSG